MGKRTAGGNNAMTSVSGLRTIAIAPIAASAAPAQPPSGGDSEPASVTPATAGAKRASASRCRIKPGVDMNITSAMSDATSRGGATQRQLPPASVHETGHIDACGK